MNKKAKKRIFDTVMATMPEHCQNPKFEQRIKKNILMSTQFKSHYIKRRSEEELIQRLSYDAEEAKRWQRTPEQLEEDKRLEQSSGLMCGNKNA